MPSFEFTDIPTSLKLSETVKEGKTVQTGALSFTVRNTLQITRVGTLSVHPPAAPGVPPAPESPDPPRNWFAFIGEPTTTANERVIEFAAAATQTQKLMVTVPAGTPGGQHRFVVRISAEKGGDNDWQDSPAVAFEVAPPKVVVPIDEKFPWWILAVVAFVLIVGGLGAYFVVKPKSATTPTQATIPSDINNTSVTTAVPELLSLGFDIRYTFQHNPAMPGKVLSSAPPYGTIMARGSIVTLTVSEGNSREDMCAHPQLCNVTIKSLEQFKRMPPVMFGAGAE